MRGTSLLAAILMVVCNAQRLNAQHQYEFQNPNLPVEQRIDNVLSLMTLQEKIDLLGKSLNIPRLGIHGSGNLDSIPGSSGQFEGLHGLAVGGPNRWGNRSPGAPGKWGGKSTIPTTQFVQSVGLGETWDPALVEKAAAEEGREARYIFQSYDRGGLIVRAPNADLTRDPRWGRSEESYGEDPYFDGTMAVAFVKGLQGNNPHYWMTAALVKHLIANSNEDGRRGSSSNFDDRLLHEYYEVPFRMAIEDGRANAYMTAYNAVNGIPMAASPLLKSLTMHRWGFNGMIDTDRGALTFMVTEHHYYPDMYQAAAGAIHAGINQFLNPYQEAVKEALQKGLITEKDIDQNLKGVFRVMIRLGYLDPPSLNPYKQIRAENDETPWTGPTSRALALKVTQESIVLLKNKGNLLPLDASRYKSIAVIGALANQVFMDGYSGSALSSITPLEGIRNEVGNKAKILYTSDHETAVQLARTADAAIVVVGNIPFCSQFIVPPAALCLDASEGQEAKDRQRLRLDPDQEKLVEDVFAVNPKTVVVLVSSFPYTINWIEQHVPAIVHMAHNSEEEGTALGSVLFGNYNPAGRLVVTWPRSISQLPPMMDYNIRNGRTYMYFKDTPLYPFGYGLSYTHFKYSDLRLSAKQLAPGGTLSASFEVSNTGDRAGDEVAQMYVRHIGSQVERPKLELEGFQRVHLQVGQTKTIQLPLAAKRLAYWDDKTHAWRLENDRIEIMVGSSSADVRLKKTVPVVQ